MKKPCLQTASRELSEEGGESFLEFDARFAFIALPPGKRGRVDAQELGESLLAEPANAAIFSYSLPKSSRH